MKEKKICLLHFPIMPTIKIQFTVCLMLCIRSMKLYTIGIINPKTNIAPHTKNNYYVNCPDRPGIGKGTFNLKVLFEIKNIIDANNIDIIYFESQHIWNMFIMLLCPFKRTVVAVHDVIPHDGNKAMTLANYVTCHLSNGVILRNYMYKNLSELCLKNIKSNQKKSLALNFGEIIQKK